MALDLCQHTVRKCFSKFTGRPCQKDDNMTSIVLFDIDRRDGRACWSPSVWKTRFVLNFKGLDYETRWLEFPDIGPTLEAQ